MGVSDTKRVAKNTLVMYIRMIFLMLIGFFTSRLLLSALGVEDYGIYSVVGSVAMTFAALKVIFSESIQRFLNYEKGKESLQRQKEVFSIAIKIHIILAIIFVILVELIGLWLIRVKLVLPIEKLDDAIFVFHMTVVTSCLYILTIPFESVVIANEQMTTFAYLSIFDGVYRLIILLILPTLDISILKAYSLSLIFTPLLMLTFLIIYCRRFEECKFTKVQSKSIFKDIISLSSWNFIGNISFSLLHEGINFIMNIFGGLSFNAARAIAYQVKNITVQMSSNLMVAARPMITQSAANNEHYVIFANIRELSRISFFIMLLTIIPVITVCEELLYIWLKEVPEYSEIFTILVLIGILIRSLHEPLNMMYMSFAKIKRMMCIEMMVMLVAIVIIYIIIKLGFPIWSAFVILSIMEIIILLTLLLNARYEVHFPMKLYIKEVVTPVIKLFCMSIILSMSIRMVLPTSNILLVLLSTFITLICCCILIFFVLNQNEKTMIKTAICKILNR